MYVYLRWRRSDTSYFTVLAVHVTTECGVRLLVCSDGRTRVKVFEYLYLEYFYEYSVLVLEFIAK